jgi:tetratricopeptide (TPR) repeat protein
VTNTSSYRRLTAGQLTQAAEYVQQYRHSPTHLKDEMPNLAAMLDVAWQTPDLHSAAWELTKAVEPLFARFGYWEQAERALRFAVEYLQDQPEQRHEFLISLNQLSSFVLQRGRNDEAETIAQAAVNQARFAVDFHQVAATTGTLIDCIYPRDIQRALMMLDELEHDPLRMTGSETQQLYGNIHIHLLRATLWRRSGYPSDVSLAEVQRAGILLDTDPDADNGMMAHVHRLIGVHAWVATRYPVAIRAFQHALHHMKKTNDVFDVSWIYGNMALVYWSMGALEQADRSVRISTRISYRLRAFFQYAHELGNLALITFSRGRLHEALHSCNRHVRYASAYCMENEQARAYGNRGALHFYLGHLSQAQSDMQIDMDYCDTKGNKAGFAPTALNMVRVYIAQNDLNEAERLLQRVEVIAEQLNSDAIRVLTLRVRAELQHGLEAIETLKSALRLAIQSLRWIDAAGCYLTLHGLTYNRWYYQGAVHLLERMGAEEWLNCPARWHNAPQVIVMC